MIRPSGGYLRIYMFKASLSIVSWLVPATIVFAQIIVDGRLGTDPYGPPRTLQNIQTGFGDNTDSDPLSAHGSELDAAYAVATNGQLYLLFTGNLETNFNKLEIFIDSKPGGQNSLAGDNPDVDFNGLNNLAGLTFDAGFEADYYLMLGGGGTPVEFFVNFAPLAFDALGIFMGGSGAGNTTFPVELSWGMHLGIDNSNTGGVTDVVVGDPASVTNGFEFCIPLTLLGNLTGSISVCAFVNSGDHTFLSNQSLPGTDSAANLGTASSVDFSAIPGDQFFTVPPGTPLVRQSLYPASDPSNTGGWILYDGMSDEFDGTEIDTDKWEGLGWTGRQPVFHAFDNCIVTNGELVMVTELRPGATTPVTESEYAIDAGYLQSKRFLRYGYYEIEARALDFPIVTTWWLTGGSRTYEREIDILETPAGNPGFHYYYGHNFHIWKTPTTNWVDFTHTQLNPAWFDLPWRLVDDYHIYGFEWDKDWMKFYIDGVFINAYATESWKVGQCIQLGNEYNNFFTSTTLVNDNLHRLPQTYRVRYLRTWLKADTDATWYVDAASGNDANSGTSWAAAKQTISAALAEAYNGDQVWVAEGTYREYLSLHGMQNMELYGGFPAGAASLAEQDPEAHPTIIRAPVDGYMPLALRSHTEGLRIDGFTLTGAHVEWDGCGLDIVGPCSNVVIANSRIINNTPSNGAGSGARVAGIGDTSVRFENCAFSGNRTLGLFPGGAGLWFNNFGSGAEVEMVNCSLTGNHSGDWGGAVGMMDRANTSLRMVNCLVANNEAPADRGAVQMNEGSLEMVNCTIVDNTGHGVRIDNNGGTQGADFYNCIVAYNSEYGIRDNGFGMTVNNGTFWFNQTHVYHGGDKQSEAEINSVGGSANNKTEDPQFVSIAVSNYQLQASSPVIDSGLAGNTEAADVAGNRRIVNYVIDRGAYEYQGIVNPNFDHDNMLNDEEFIAGTDMMDSNSVWEIEGFRIMSPASLTFRSVVGRVYACDYSEDLAVIPQVWTEFTNDIPGTGASIMIADPEEATNRNFRVRVRLAP